MGNGQRKSLCNVFKADTKSSTRAALLRSLHNQPINSKPSCAAKQPRSLSLISSRRRRACLHSIMSMYMFSAQSLSLLNLQRWENKKVNTKDKLPFYLWIWPNFLGIKLEYCEISSSNRISIVVIISVI